MTILNRSQHPEFRQVKQILLPDIEVIKLPNNIKVHVIKGGTQDLVKFDVLIKAGAIYSTEKLHAPFTSLMLNEGTSKLPAHQLSEAFDFYGTHFSPVAEKDNAFVSLITLNKHIENTLPLLVDVLTDCTFPENEMNVMLERKRNNFLVDIEKTSFLAREEFSEVVFGKNHPYGKKSKLEDYNELSRNELYQFYKKHYHAGNFEVVVAGNATDKIIELINKNFGAIPASETTSYKKTALIEPDNHLHFVEKEDAVQSSIRIGMQTINKTHTDYLSLKILVTILGGYFGSRLMKNIREEKGYTYGIHAMLVSFIQTGYIGIAADVKAENAKEALIEIEKEINKLKAEPVTLEELNLVKNYMLGELLQSLDGPLALSDVYKSAIQFNFDFQYYQNYKDTILSITPERLQELAIKYFDFSKMAKVVAGQY